MNKLTLTLPAALFACVMFIGASQFAEAGGRGGGRGGGGRGIRGGAVIKGQRLSVPGGVRNLRGPVKGQALSVPGGVRNIGRGSRRFGGGLGLGAGFGAGYGYGGVSGFAPWLYDSGHIPVPPYFALHPPVYYSHPVPRTYGYSPFAYPRSVRTPEIVEATPAVITNPYFDKQDTLDSKASEESDDVVSTVTPQEILNPYVDVNHGAGEHQVAKTTEHLTDDHREESKEDSGLSEDDTTGVTPHEILNPYVESEA